MKDKLTIKDIMTSSDLVVVKLDTTFTEVKSIFDKNNFHHLPVVDEMAMVKGIISKNDFSNLAYHLSKQTAGKTFSEKTYNHLTAKEIMIPNPVYLNPDDRIGLAADLFLENKYHALPVMEDGVLMGIVTSHDLLVHAYYQSPVGEK